MSPYCQGVPKVKLSSEEFASKLLDRRSLPSPDTKIHQIMLSQARLRDRGGPFGNRSMLNNTQPSFGDDMVAKNDQNPSFYIVRDDLLHPFVNGNKARKLDGLLGKPQSIMNLDRAPLYLAITIFEFF